MDIELTMSARELQIFISYQRADGEFARQVREHLAAHGVRTWMDQYNIPVGAYWPDEIDKGLAASDIVIGILSPDAVESRNVKNEWDWALQNDKQLLLLQVQPTNIPHRYVSINFVDATGVDPQTAFAALLAAIGVDGVAVDERAPSVAAAPIRHGARRAARLYPSAPLVIGREREQASLAGMLDDALARECRLALVAGEAGIGKTTLTRWLAWLAEERGALVLAGGCQDLSTTRPYGPWVELLRGWPVDQLGPMPDELRDGADLGAIQSQAALFDLIADSLLRGSDARPLVLLLEDVHWADQGSLDLLRHLARSLVAARILIVATYRDDELTRRHPLQLALNTLAREQLARRVAVRRLDAEATHELVAARYAMPDDERERLVAYIQRLTEGNPFFADEVLTALEETGALTRDAAGWRVARLEHVQVPALVRGVIDARVARLGDDVRLALEVAAVIGHEAPVELWLAASRLDEALLSETLERATDAHLIEETRVGFRFTHALIRETLYEGLVLLRRRAVHRTVGELLAAGARPDPDAVAHHFQQGGDSRAFDWLIRAGDRAQRTLAVQTAIERFEAAAVLAELDDERTRDRAWLLYRIARLQRIFDDLRGLRSYDEAERLAFAAGDPVLQAFIPYDRLHTRCRSGDVRAALEMPATIDVLATLPVAELLRDPSKLPWLADYLPGRSTDLTVGLERMQSAADVRLGTFMVWIGTIGHFDDVLEVGEPYIERIAAGARSQLLESPLADACFALGLLYCQRLQPQRSAALFELGRQRNRVIESPVQVAGAYMGELEACAIPFDTLNLARRDELVAGICENVAHSSLAWQRSLWLAPAQVVEGRWDELAPAMAAMDANPNVVISGWAALRILPWIGNTELLERVTRDQLPELWDTAPGSAAYHATVELQRTNAEAALIRGNAPAMRPWVDAYDRWIAWAGDLGHRPSAARLRAGYHRAAGDVAEARRCAEEALRLAGEPRQPLEELAATRLLGELDTAEGQHERAAARLVHALAIATAARAPFEAALTRIAQAELSIATGHGDATTLLIDARGVCEPLHAVPVLQRIAMLEARLE